MRRFLIVIFMLALSQSACGSVKEFEPTITPTKNQAVLIATGNPIPATTPTVTATSELSPTMLPTKTEVLSGIDFTATPPWRSPTPQPPTTEEAFEALCDEFDSDYRKGASISPDENWTAISCGYKENQIMLVLNNQEIRWLLDYQDFIRPDFADLTGALRPIVWSSDGRFLYFTKELGWDGGGNQCFVFGNMYGLYRLHLQTGTVVTMFPTDDQFSGDQISFSPNTEYYAIEYYANHAHRLRIANTLSGEVEVMTINASNVMSMIWSPDSRYLAYSVASCGEQLVEDSSLYVWDSDTRQSLMLYSVEDMLLADISWVNNTTIRFKGEVWDGSDVLITYFEYDLVRDGLTFSATATPRP